MRFTSPQLALIAIVRAAAVAAGTVTDIQWSDFLMISGTYYQYWVTETGLTQSNNVKPQQIFYIQSGDWSTTSTALANITDLVFPMKASKRYFITGWIRCGCNNVGGYQYGFTSPAGSTKALQLFGDNTGSTAFARSVALTADSTGTTTIGVFNSVANFVLMRIDITIGATAGDFQLMMKSVTAGQTSTIYERGTVFMMQEVEP